MLRYSWGITQQQGISSCIYDMYTCQAYRHVCHIVKACRQHIARSSKYAKTATKYDERARRHGGDSWVAAGADDRDVIGARDVTSRGWWRHGWDGREAGGRRRRDNVLSLVYQID